MPLLNGFVNGSCSVWPLPIAAEGQVAGRHPDKVGRGEGYGQVIGDVKRGVTPNDQFAANYVVGCAVNLLCPELIWQLRNSAGGYQPPDGAPPFSTYY